MGRILEEVGGITSGGKKIKGVEGSEVGGDSLSGRLGLQKIFRR